MEELKFKCLKRGSSWKGEFIVSAGGVYTGSYRCGELYIIDARGKEWNVSSEVECFKQIEGENSMMNQVKTYFNKHQEAIFTIALLVLIDHFVFHGVFREKIKGMVEKFVDGVQGEKK